MNNSSLHVSEERLQLIVAAAHAYYEQNATQQQIAQELGISRSQVSRYLDKAREMEIVTIQINQPDSHSYELESKLKSLYPFLRDVLVVPFSSANITGDSLMGRAAARYLMDQLYDGVSLGVGAGRSVRSAINWLKPTSHKVRVVQTMGSTGYFAQGIDYTLLANEAATKLQAPVHILNAPTVLWKNAGTVDRLIAGSKQLADTLEISKNCNIYIVGVGAIHNDDVFVKSGLIDETEMEEVRNSGAVGNICACFFKQNGDICHTSFEERIFGIRREDLQHAETSILIAAGSSKVSAIVGALRGRLANVLSTDYQTALQIIEFEAKEV